MKPMLPAHPRAPRWAVAATVLATAGVLAGCGAEPRDDAGIEGPPLPIVVNASIDDHTVTISPRRLLVAGPITLLITNESKASQQVTLEQDAAAGVAAAVQTGPINPRETAQIEARVQQGDYALHVGAKRVRAARLVVGASVRTPRTDS
jgi:hypothetical protein